MHCVKCKGKNYHTTDCHLVGDYKVSLCHKHYNDYVGFLKSRYEYDQYMETKTKLKCAIHVGNTDEAVSLVKQLVNIEHSLYQIAETWCSIKDEFGGDSDLG